MLSELSFVIFHPGASRKIRNFLYILLDGEEHSKRTLRSSLPAQSLSVHLHLAVSYSNRPFPFASHIHTSFPSPALCPCLSYLNFPAPWLCRSILFSTSFLTLLFSSATASKLPRNANTTQQNVALFFACLSCPEAWPEEGGKKLSRAHFVHHICGLGHRQGRDTWCRRTSVCHIFCPAGETWQRLGSVLSFRCP